KGDFFCRQNLLSNSRRIAVYHELPKLRFMTMPSQTDHDIEVDAAMAQLGPNFLASVKTPTRHTAASPRERNLRGFVVEHVRPRRRAVFTKDHLALGS
ncbi:MAG: hypothetical protein WCJ64_10990, partial [Rhodospirillaceae bacterium]